MKNYMFILKINKNLKELRKLNLKSIRNQKNYLTRPVDIHLSSDH